MNETQGKEVGTIRVRKYLSTNGENANNIYLVALLDSKHASMMLTSWCAAVINDDSNGRRVGSELVQFKHGEAQKNCCYDRHAVDDDNSNRQGFS